MNNHEYLAEQFEAERAHLRGVAYRMLGSLSEAEDAVQEAWLRISRTDANAIENLGGWLTTVVARICLDVLRSRSRQREDSLDGAPWALILNSQRGDDPETEAVLADSVGLALMVVLERLRPAERIAFVLHDIFDVPFDTIAPIVGRTAAATRQLASRARRRVQGGAAADDADLVEQRAVVEAFLAASRSGDFDALLALLDPEVVLRADRTAVSAGGPAEAHGATTIAKRFFRRAERVRAALVNGRVGAVLAPWGRLLMILEFTITNGRITAISVIADPTRLPQIELGVLEG